MRGTEELLKLASTCLGGGSYTAAVVVALEALSLCLSWAAEAGGSVSHSTEPLRMKPPQRDRPQWQLNMRLTLESNSL